LHLGSSLTLSYRSNFRFNVRVRGCPTLPVVLFLHGFLGSCEEFSPIAAQLCDRFCCLSIDLPGHGKTQVVGDYTMSSTARAIVHLLDRLNIHQAILVGYSLGGRLALYLALHFADRFPQIILESASPGLQTKAERSTRRQHDDRLAAHIESDFSTFLIDWYDQPLFRSLRQHPTFDAIYQQRLKNTPIELAKSLRSLSIGRQPNLWGKLADYEHPLLLLVGENDRKFVAINQEIAAQCRTAQLKILVNTGHNLHVENPSAFTMHVKEFLFSTQYKHRK
jgi:2-succinyl-6-hydroxy-2,4-cyclohexadiene-1-carboxylate synthase